MKWHQRARRLAEEKGLSHERLAEILGKGRSTVSGWFNGIREPKLDEIFAIADALGVTRKWLLFGDEKNEQSDVIGDQFKAVPIINGTGKNSYETIYVPDHIACDIAYEVHENTGISEIPVGAIVGLNVRTTASHNDFVYVRNQGEKEGTVYRLIRVGGQNFFGSDDPRIPLIPESKSLSIDGVVVFININLKD